MADISGSIGVAPSDGSTAVCMQFVWWTVQRSGYLTAKVVNGEHRANQLQAQSQEPLNCRLDLDHTSAHGKHCAHVGNTRRATGEGGKGKLRSALVPLII